MQILASHKQIFTFLWLTHFHQPGAPLLPHHHTHTLAHTHTIPSAHSILSILALIDFIQLSVLVWRYIFIVLAQVRVPNAQWGQTNWNVRVWSRERFIAGPYEETGGFCPKSPELPEVFGQTFLKARWGRWGRRLCDQLMHNSLTHWWWGNRVVSQGFTLSVLRLQEAWGLCAHGHQVVNIFHLVGSFHIWKTTHEMCIKYCYLGTSERS